MRRFGSQTMLVATVALLAPACAHSQTPPRGLITFEQVAAATATAPDHVLRYGSEPSQFGELRIPAGRGPHPLAILVHGGCWSAQYDLTHLAAAAADLRQAGVATWTLEYRRLGEQGGGWPGTFHDIGAGADHIRTVADSFNLDLTRIVAVGHSAGGHLALWLAGRDLLPETSELWHPTPLRLSGVIGLAAIPDLEGFASGPGGCNTAAAELVGGSAAEQESRYRQASPVYLLPFWIPIRLFHGDLDPIVSTLQSNDFAAAAFQRGEDATSELLPGAGHFDLVAPGTAAWSRVRAAVLELLEVQ